MKKSKIYNSRGSAMVLVIVCMAIIMIVIPMISFQNINQVKSTSDNQNMQSYKYAAEAGVDKILAEACKQVEAVDIAETKYIGKSSNDKFHVIKNKLKLVLNDVENLKLNEDTKKLRLELEKTINYKYTQQDELVKQLKKIKEITLETTGELCYESDSLRLSMYNIMEKINNILDISYTYDHEDHESIVFIDKNDNQVIMGNKKLIDQLFSNSINYEYNISNINKNEVNSAKGESQSIISVIGWHPYGKVSEYIQKTIVDGITEITDYITGGKAPQGSYRSIRDMLIDLQSTLSQGKLSSSEEFIRKKNDTCTTIDNVIKSINDLEIKLYKIYTEKANLNGVNSEYPITGIREHAMLAIKYLDLAKQNLIETRCKLNGVQIPSDDTDGGTEPGKINVIDIPKDKHDVNDDVKCETYKIREELEIENNGIKDVKLEIISKGYSEKNENKNYKIKSEVIITGKLKDGKMQTSYKIISHDKIN